MAEDIVTRLRSCKLIRLTTGGGGEETSSPLHVEAADEIERLRAVLQHYADENYNGYNANGAYARAALEENKDD